MNTILKQSITLTQPEIIERINAIRSGNPDSEKLRNDIVMANVRLVTLVMKPYFKNTSIDPDDLMNEGVLGIYEAIENYDPSKAVFSTYAFQWIRQKINRYVQKMFATKIDLNSVSIDKNIGDEEDGTTIGDILANTDDPSYEAGVESEKSIVHSCMDSITDLEKAVLKFRYHVAA